LETGAEWAGCSSEKIGKGEEEVVVAIKRGRNVRTFQLSDWRRIAHPKRGESVTKKKGKGNHIRGKGLLLRERKKKDGRNNWQP